LRFFGVLARLTEREVGLRTMELLELFGLRERADERTGTYSKGMKQRLALARAWLNYPKLLFLDEPTSGLDPEAALQVRELIADIRQQERTTVLICTHNLDEAQRLCGRLLIMNAGRALALGSLTELRRLVSPGLWVEIAFHLPFPAHTGAVSAANIPGVLRSLSPTEHLLRLEVEAEQIIPQVITSLVQSGAQIVRVQPQEISLEEVYLKLQNSVHSLDGVQGGRHAELS
jgi:ABC-2 type transport system ATP-binding protein